jgi:acyl-CoA thioester hydrolase
MSSELTETYRGAIYPWHCDHMGHMNVMWYVGKFDEATWNLFAMLGVTATYLKENRRGMAAVQQNITYRREMRAGDTAAVRSAAAWCAPMICLLPKESPCKATRSSSFP